MATKRFCWGAPLVAQLNTWTFGGTWLANETITVTIGQKAWVYTLTSGTIATFLPLLEAAYNALEDDEYPEMAEQTADSTATTFTLVADEAGKPFTATISTNSSSGTINGGASSTGTATTASSSPEDLWLARNYDDGVLPANGDTVWIERSDRDIKWNLAGGAAITTLTIHKHSTHTGKLGLPIMNEDGTPYPEYRARYAKFDGCTLCNIGFGTGDQGPMTYFDFGTSAATVNIYGSGTSDQDGLHAICIKGTSSSNAIRIVDGEVDIAPLGGETANVSGAFVVGSPGGAGNPVVRCGNGVTIGAVSQFGGTLETNAAIATSLTMEGGVATLNGTGAIAALTMRKGAVCNYNTSGTLGGAPVLTEGSVLSFDGDARAKTVTNPIDCHSGAQVIDNNKVVGTLIIDFNNFDPGMNVGSNFRLTRGATA